MRTAPPRAITGLLILSTILVLATFAPVAGDDDDVNRRLNTLNKRLDTLEKTLGTRTGDAAGTSVVDRLDTLERALGQLSRAAGKPKWSSPEGNLRELERTLASAERERAALTSRLSQLERSLRHATDCSQELRTLKTQLDGFRRDLRDLQSRVRRLESRP